MISDKNYLLPALPGELPVDILEKASLLPAKAAFLDGRLAPATRARLVSLLEVTNTYYSNLIEGQYSAPADMQRAQAAPKRERKQLNDLAMQQLGVQTSFERILRRWDEDITWSTMFSPWLVKQVHKALFKHAPAEQLKLHDSERYLVPGKLRAEPDEQVEVGQHLAPDAQVVHPMLELLQQFMGGYKDPRTRLIAALAYHHRLAWVHPFMDGNGRLVRLMTHLQLVYLDLRPNLWSLSRGLARRQTDYYAMMANADRPREGDLDGRGQLSLKHYLDFIRFMLDVCLDQIDYMSEALDPARMRQRIERLFKYHERINAAKIRPGSAAAVHALLSMGTMPRATFKTFLGLSERLAIDELKRLIELGVVLSPTPKSRNVEPGLPVWFAQEIFPDLHRRFT
ncbi:Fic family protein [Ectopseudomonas guguanensis]|uniref:Fic family protein n=1 Tax=Ectopseudomonas guguanensis TaxID=1198456 RepID=A0A1H0TZK8_9GAMM|nr:Fic family protein [Pseudomonas guguanensis]SDP59006.1 Fic family protein [Pseudomonas guguanensis]